MYIVYTREVNAVAGCSIFIKRLAVQQVKTIFGLAQVESPWIDVYKLSLRRNAGNASIQTKYLSWCCARSRPR